jgi:type IV secretion system protein VirB10
MRLAGFAGQLVHVLRRTQMTVIMRVVVCTVGCIALGAAVAQAQPRASRHMLTGTYQLQSARSDDPRRATDAALRGLPPVQRARLYESLLSRLQAPDVIAIERFGMSVTMASTNASRMTFDADGRDRQEQWSPDRTMTTRVSLAGERLLVATTGHRGSDFTVTFEPTMDGRTLNMTRTIDDDGLRQPVTVRSAYRRTSNDARWNIAVAGGGGMPGNGRGRPSGRASAAELVIPDGTRFVAVLDRDLATNTLREGDRYTMTARAPYEFEGAVIQGFVSEVSDSRRMAGRAGMTLNIESIRARDGRSYQLDGTISDVRTPGGEPVRVDRAGNIDSRDSQTQKTVERSIIGAALGAMIGAAAGGGKGAAIGAVIGAGGGAGTVMIEGRDRLELPQGTEVTFISGDPRRPGTGPRESR